MVTYSKTYTAATPQYAPKARQVGVLSQILTLGTADVGATGTFTLGYLPANSMVIDGVAAITDVDSGTAFVVAVGDSGDSDKFINGATMGQAAAVVRFGNNATSAKTMAEHAGYTAPTKMVAEVITQAGTAVAGTMTVKIIYETMEPPA